LKKYKNIIDTSSAVLSIANEVEKKTYNGADKYNDEKMKKSSLSIEYNFDK